jgi:hypothetical protein
VEDLPMWGYIGDISDEDVILGEVEGSQTFLFPHLHFFLGYNKDQIVSAKVTTDVRASFFNWSIQLALLVSVPDFCISHCCTLILCAYYRWSAVSISPMSKCP